MAPKDSASTDLIALSDSWATFAKEREEWSVSLRGAEKDIEHLKEDIRDIKKKVDELVDFKARMVVNWTVISAISGVVGLVAGALLKKFGIL